MMNKERIKKLKKYLCPKLGGLIAGGAFLLLAFISVVSADSAPSFLFFGFFVALLFSWSAIRDLSLCHEYFTEIEQKDEMIIILDDFENGIQAVDDSLRLGGTYVIGKRGIRVFRYDEIYRVYEYVHKTNFAVDQHELWVVCTDGNTHTLCHLPLNAEDQQIMSAFFILNMKNERILFGTK